MSLRRGPGGLKSQIEMFDDLVYDFIIFNKGNNAHGSPAFGTDKGIDRGPAPHAGIIF